MKSDVIRAITDALELVNTQDNFSVEITTRHGVFEFARKKFPSCQSYLSCSTYLWGAYLEARPEKLVVEYRNGIISIRGTDYGINAGINANDIQNVSIGEPYDCIHRIVVYRRGE